ncbi:MAG: hypothetical protein EB168_07855 [Euryarchaeota archaeon]|nr:hypothetical protein [Euryarchaeota archaeon]
MKFSESPFYQQKLAETLHHPDTGEVLICVNRKLTKQMVMRAKDAGVVITRGMLHNRRKKYLQREVPSNAEKVANRERQLENSKARLAAQRSELAELIADDDEVIPYDLLNE